jgi:hypothetical protein
MAWNIGSDSFRTDDALRAVDLSDPAFAEIRPPDRFCADLAEWTGK